MDSERVNEIRAALDALPPETKYLSDGQSRMVIWLRDLLAENERLTKVADAARALDSDFGRAIALGERDAIEANVIEDYMEGVRLLDVLFKVLKKNATE